MTFALKLAHTIKPIKIPFEKANYMGAVETAFSIQFCIRDKPKQENGGKNV